MYSTSLLASRLTTTRTLTGPSKPVGDGGAVTRTSALLTKVKGIDAPFHRTVVWPPGWKFAPQISTSLPPTVVPDDGESAPIDGVPSSSSGSSSTSTTGSASPVPGSGSVVLPVVLPSPLVAGSSVLPVGGGGGTSAGGGVSVVGDGTSPVVDLPSPETAVSTTALATVLPGADGPPLFTACVRNSSRLPLPLMIGAPLAPGNSPWPSSLRRRVTVPSWRSQMKMSRARLKSCELQISSTLALPATVANTTKRPS